MAKSIRTQFLSGVAWSSISRFSSLGIQFLVTIVLARLLSPEDFGVIALLTVFIAIAQILLDSGFGDALIQRESKSSLEYSSVFYLNILIGVACYFLLYIVSPLLDTFYNINGLHKYARVLFLVIPINALGLIQRVQLRQSLSFKKLSIIEIFAALISGLIGICLAHFGFGVYSLIGQMFTINFLRTILTIIINRWHPTLEFSFVALKPLFKFGVNLTFTGLLTVIFNNIHTIIIGRYYSPKSVGYFNQARQYEQLSSNTITEIVMSVSYPTLVKLKSDIIRLREVYKKIIEMVVFLVVPLMCILFIVSDDLLVFLLSEKWLPSSIYFKILCVYGITFPLHQLNGNILKVKGESKRYLYIEIVRRLLLIISIVLTLKISIEAMLYGQILSMIIIIIISMYYSGKLINYRLITQFKDIIPYYIAGILSFAVTLYFYQFLLFNPLAKIMISSLILMLIYILICRLFVLDALNNVLKLFKNRKL